MELIVTDRKIDCQSRNGRNVTREICMRRRRMGLLGMVNRDRPWSGKTLQLLI